MKLTIGENIRHFRKQNDLTQEAFADRLGVTYQSISRWENGATYPDLELIPAIAEILAVTVDELLGMPQIEREKRAAETFDELRRECMRQDYNSEKISDLLRDIRRNYLNSNYAWRPWSEGNGRAFRDQRILPEVRLLAEAWLERHPMDPHVIQTMAEIEDEEHIKPFLGKYTTPFDCSAPALLFNRYLTRGDAERFEPVRRYQLYQAFNTLLSPRYLLKWGEGKAQKTESEEFMEAVLSLIRSNAVDDRPDIWVPDRIELGIKLAMRLVADGSINDALVQLESVVKLLEETMNITDEISLPTSCRFLDGMDWIAKEDWISRDNNPDSPKERMIYMGTQMDGMCSCYCVFPSVFLDMLRSNTFKPLFDHRAFEMLCARVKALIVTKPEDE